MPPHPPTSGTHAEQTATVMAGVKRALLEEPADAVLMAGDVNSTMVAAIAAAKVGVPGRAAQRIGVTPGEFALVKFHRPALVDDLGFLRATLEVLSDLAESLPVILPVQPRTRKRMVGAQFAPPPRLHRMDPLGYLDFIALEADASLVVTDSGGVWEETTILEAPCLMYRTTERPITVSAGINRLLGLELRPAEAGLLAVLAAPFPPARRRYRWDGACGHEGS